MNHIFWLLIFLFTKYYYNKIIKIKNDLLLPFIGANLTFTWDLMVQSEVMEGSFYSKITILKNYYLIEDKQLESY